MKKILKKILTMSLAVTILIQIAGCGEKQSSDEEKVTLRLWTKLTQDASEEQKYYHDELMADLHEKFPDVIFEEALAPVGTDYRQEYDKALMAGTAPSIMDRFSYTDIPTRIANGTIADITKYIEDWDLRKEGKILTTFDEAISKDGKWYAIPKSAYTQATLVNKRLLRENGEDENNLPVTWDEFAQQGQRITDFSVPRIGYALLGMDWCAWPFTAWIWSAGGEMVRDNGDGTWKIAFNEPAGVDTAMFMNEMIWKYKMTQKDILMSTSDIQQLAQNQTAAYSWQSLSIITEGAAERYGFSPDDYEVMPMPVKDVSIQRPSLAGGEVITFDPKLTEEELAVAVEVAKFIYCSEERMDAECEHIKRFKKIDVKIPARIDLYEKKLSANSNINDKKIEQLNKLVEVSKPEPFCPHWTDVKTQLVIPLQEIYLDEDITREEIQKKLDDCAETLYKLYPDTFRK